MSGEQLSQDYLDKNHSKSSYGNSKVDINVLLNKVRLEQKKEKLENLIFISLISFVVIITGVIVSL